MSTQENLLEKPILKILFLKPILRPQKKLFDNGLHLKATGDAAIIAPPLIAERQHVDTIVDILRRTLKSL